MLGLFNFLEKQRKLFSSSYSYSIFFFVRRAPINLCVSEAPSKISPPFIQQASKSESRRRRIASNAINKIQLDALARKSEQVQRHRVVAACRGNLKLFTVVKYDKS
jgi:hypothetical protein